jgi:2-polyprenyl-3-methyl-5-hydroxy-6-metoxy-1,4-benzoquinol methylase
MCRSTIRSRAASKSANVPPPDRVRRCGLSPEEAPHLGAFSDALPAGVPVLDIGCGAGEPIARMLTERGLQVTELCVANRVPSGVYGSD